MTNSHNSVDSVDSVDSEWPPTLSSYEQVQSELRAAIEAHPPFGDWLLRACNAGAVCKGGKYLHMSVPQMKEEYSKHAKQQALQTATAHAMAEEHLVALRNSPGYTFACEEKLRCEEVYKSAMALYNNESLKIAAAGGYRACKMLTPPRPPPWDLSRWDLQTAALGGGLFTADSSSTHSTTIIMTELVLNAVISKTTQAQAERLG